MISNNNSVLTTLSVKNWTGYKHDKRASQQTIDNNRMENGAGRFNKKLLPKYAFKDIKEVITQFKIYFLDNTLPYDALLGTRILPTENFIDFNKNIAQAQQILEKFVKEFKDNYPEYLEQAKELVGDLYKESDYPTLEDISSKYDINVSFFPVPDSDQFNQHISNKQIQRLNDQMKEISEKSIDDLYRRTYKVATTLMKTVSGDCSRVYHTTTVSNVDALVEQLTNLNYNQDPGIIELKGLVEDNLVGVRMDYLKNSKVYRTKLQAKIKIVLDHIGTMYDLSTL